MATINYTTLKLPELLWHESEVIQNTPHFEVRKYNHKKGIIFRLPNGAKPGQIHHAFMEHEINLSNTLRTGTLTMKILVTFLPCHIGIFSGFKTLKGSYQSDFDDEVALDSGYFMPNYDHPDNIKNVVPLPPNIKSNLYEYLNEILFKHTDDAEIIDQYAVELGCKTQDIEKNIIKSPVLTSNTFKGSMKFSETVNFFKDMKSGKGSSLIPEDKKKETVYEDEFIAVEKDSDDEKIIRCSLINHHCNQRNNNTNICEYSSKCYWQYK